MGAHRHYGSRARHLDGWVRWESEGSKPPQIARPEANAPGHPSGAPLGVATGGRPRDRWLGRRGEISIFRRFTHTNSRPRRRMSGSVALLTPMASPPYLS